MELGIYTFADVAADPATGVTITPQKRLANLLEEIELADQVGLDVFGVGEHHRPDYAVSAPAVVLAAAAARTKSIRLTSAVSVLSSDDPVRVFQAFSTVDLISGGRAEIMAGRGSFIESFPLFGYNLDDYDALFAEKLDLILAIREHEKVSWPGGHRPAIDGRGVYPRPVQEKLPIWVAIGGTPQSVVRAGSLGLPLAVAIIGGEPERFAPLIALYHEAAARAGHDPTSLKIGINSHGFVGPTADAAVASFYPAYAEVMSRIGRERGWSGMSRSHFDAARSLRGSMVLGEPQAVIDKILYQHEKLRHQRFLMQMGVGAVPHADLMRSIELFGTVVAPAVRKALGISERPAARQERVASGADDGHAG